MGRLVTLVTVAHQYDENDAYRRIKPKTDFDMKIRGSFRILLDTRIPRVSIKRGKWWSIVAPLYKGTSYHGAALSQGSRADGGNVNTTTRVYNVANAVAKPGQYE